MSDNSKTQEVVWYNPIDYDALKHGPPYLPSMGSIKLSSDQRAEVKAFVKTAAFYDDPQLFKEVRPTPSGLMQLLGLLQALVMLHQAHHWNTQGSTYYADHLLFGRIYDDSVGFVDSLAEKMLGTQDSSKIRALEQVTFISQILGAFGQGTTPDEMASISLKAEVFCLDLIAKVMGTMELQGKLSHGMSNLLEGIADKHEEFVYLLRQRSSQDYNYDRR